MIVDIIIKIITKKEISKILEIKKISQEHINKIIDLIKEIYNKEYSDKEFYDKNVITHYIKRINSENGGAWKGVFIKDELIAQMLAVIENNHVKLKLAMMKKEYRNLGIMRTLSISMIKEIDKYQKSDFATIFAFINPENIPIVKILNKFKYIKVGALPFHEIGNNYVIYCKIIFTNNAFSITPHYKIRKKIEKIIKILALKRTVIEKKSFATLSTTNKSFNLNKIKSPNSFPIKYYLYDNYFLLGEFYENIYNHSWYDFSFINDCSLEVKLLVLKKVISLFEIRSSINTFSLIVDVDDFQIHEILLKSKFIFCAYLPLYYGIKDGVLFGMTKIKQK